jgi:hypothetical protein
MDRDRTEEAENPPDFSSAGEQLNHQKSGYVHGVYQQEAPKEKLRRSQI